ncbi:MAG: hypothetical protein ACTSU2_11470 [Promethearchaeota archaeon]
MTHRYQQVGNYYWNYTGNDTNHDYIGDTPYVIYNGVDYAPIVYGALDNDEDNLTNYEEEVYGTDPNSLDTDGDGLSDWFEIKVLNTDPLKKDTDGDGIPDNVDNLPNQPSPGLFGTLSIAQAIIFSAIILGSAIVIYAIALSIRNKAQYKTPFTPISRRSREPDTESIEAKKGKNKNSK